nr:acyl-CoA dehydrogenase family protein [Sulfodiicoccus acidiphilus]
MLRDAKTTTIYEGTNLIQRMIVVRQVMRKLYNLNIR